MKKILLLVMLIASIGTMKAQWSITPEVGMSSALQIGYGSDNWRPGWKIGAGIEYDVKPGLFSLKSGLYYNTRKSEHYDYFVDTEKEEWGMIENHVKRHFFQVPVMGKLSFRVDDDVYFTIAAGPYIAVRIATKEEWYPMINGYNFEHPSIAGGYDYSYGGYDYSNSRYGPYSNVSANTFRRFDWGLTGSIGMEIKKWVVNLGYDFALGEEFKYGYDSIGAHYHTLSLSVGYKFSLGK